MSDKIQAILKEREIPLRSFDHFDYVEAFEALPLEELDRNPHRRRQVEQFTAKCVSAMNQPKKTNNFLQRMEYSNRIRNEKLTALKFIQETYDQKNKQLLFYPRTTPRLATQKGKHWKNTDIWDSVQQQISIHAPNVSQISMSDGW